MTTPEVYNYNVSVDPQMGINTPIVAFIFIFWLFMFIVGIIKLIATWKIYNKAGRPGWASIVPIYNIIIMLKIINRPWWWIFLLLIPIVNIVIHIIMLNLLAKSFGERNPWFTVGLVLLPFIFYPILAFGKSKFVGNDLTAENI